MLAEMVKEGKTKQELRVALKTTYDALDKRLASLGTHGCRREHARSRCHYGSRRLLGTLHDRSTIEGGTGHDRRHRRGTQHREGQMGALRRPPDRNARIKTKFDVVEQDGKLIKQTEVRFVIEEEMK